VAVFVVLVIVEREARTEMDERAAASLASDVL
jgi:hypothetical protein